MQGMDLPVEIWARIARFMELKEWAQACGTCCASFAARTVIAAVQPTSFGAGVPEQRRLWQMDKWPTCHSLFLNLRYSFATSTDFYASVIPTNGRKMESLRCLHIVDGASPTHDNLTGLLMSHLGGRYILLSLHVRAVESFPELTNLRHLILNIDGDSSEGWTHRRFEARNGMAFEAIRSLTSLRTLYVESYFVFIEITWT